MPQRKTPSLGKIILFCFLIVVTVLSGIALQIMRQLPNVETIATYSPSESTQIISSDGKVIARLHEEENRQVVSLSQISPYVPKMVIAVEDPNFYRHHGFDFWRIIRSGIKNLAYGRIVEGGSTVTQQLARNIFLTRKKTFSRKFAEILLAMQLERRYTKEEILELYLNQVYFGHNAYGIESAANLYFGKSAKDLGLAQSAMLVGIIRGPELYSPYRNLKGAKLRQIYTLNKAWEQSLIPEEAAKAAAAENLVFSPKNLKRFGGIAPYFIDGVLKELLDKFGEEKVYRGGMRVYTTLDTAKQYAAEEIITRFVSEEGKKYNFSQAALVSIDPRTGYVKAMVGGYDYLQSKFNRATQAKRQPGSAFKPFVYAAAIEQGIPPGEILMDTATSFDVYPNKWNPYGKWEPKNFDRKFRGAVTMRYSLEKSLNLPSIKLLERVGIASAIDLAQRMGITSHLEPGLALTLGVSEVSLLEITSAYGTFADNGIYVTPVMITKIEGRDGAAIFKNSIEEKKALDSNVAAIMVDMMKGVLTRGTGIRGQINRPAAAKTGTTENFHDAWFIGFVPQLVTGVWVGNDNNAPMKGVAEVAVCPRIWKAYNLSALSSEPVLDFPKPEGLTNVKICIISEKLAGPYCPTSGVRWATVWEKDAPRQTCTIHKKAPEEKIATSEEETYEEKEEYYNYHEPKDDQP